MYLFFDTETTGLPKNWNAPLTDLNNWPRIVQLAWQYYNEKGILQASANRIIRPEGFIIPEQASNVHGITTEKALAEGIALKDALLEFADVLSASQFLVAHNINFDEKVTGAEFLRNNIPYDLFSLAKVCTMNSAVDFCALPGNYGYKWPTLMELHNKLFKEGFDGAHDALADVTACARCFFELKNRGIIG